MAMYTVPTQSPAQPSWGSGSMPGPATGSTQWASGAMAAPNGSFAHPGSFSQSAATVPSNSGSFGAAQTSFSSPSGHQAVAAPRLAQGQTGGQAVLQKGSPVHQQHHVSGTYQSQPQQQVLLQSRQQPRPDIGARQSQSSVFTQSQPSTSKLECQDQQCAEEECNPDECGDETRPPRDDNYTCGIDRRPLLPVLLLTSTVIGLICMLMLQFPLARDLTGGIDLVQTPFLALYAVTLGCMVYCALCDPGQLKREDQRKAGILNVSGSGEEQVPKRAHKTWLYKLPIRRYDHYCRWLTNCIGLLNHREFLVMLVGLVVIGVCGAIVDFVLICDVTRQGGAWTTDTLLAIHLAYSVGLTTLAYPILRLHVGFVSRNELANEWKRNDFYIVYRSGKAVAVNDLSDDEFNERFDADDFVYDASKNSFDNGMSANCWQFWCTARWKTGELGDF